MQQKPKYKQDYFLLVGQKKFPLTNRQTLIGRNPNASIFVDDHTIAKDHAIIELDENMMNPKLIDRGSVSGCTVNGTKVEKNGCVKLYQSDGIKFGAYPIEYKLQVTMPEGLGAQQIDDGKSDLSRVDKRIELVKDFHPNAAFATMDHLDDSLDS